MISVSEKKWVETNVNKNLIEKVKQDFNFSDILAKLIISRNFNHTEIHNINNNLDVNNIFKKNIDFNKAAELLINSISKKEKIYILGDYDVDGSVATSLLVRFCDHIKQPYFYYIPDREQDGYGASKELFKKLILKKPKLIIMVDCGSTSNEAIDYLNKNKIKSIIIDHHEINKPYPKSNVIINPKKNDGYEKYNYLCAAALTYFFLEIVINKIKSNYKLYDFLIYVLLATVCDVMPLRKINRIIAKNVLNNFKLENNNVISSLFKLSDKNDKLTINDLGFFIGPIINSGGRLRKSSYGTQLLTSNNVSFINKKAKQLIELNNKRKNIESAILNQINFKKIQKENKSVIVYYNQNINEGLIGIIAARLKDYFNKPSIVITKSNNKLKGSARSTNNYNIGQIIKVLSNKEIIKSGGGHNMAAGFIMKKNKLNILEDFLLKDYANKVPNIVNQCEYDARISPSALNVNFIDDIKKLGPFGASNQLPIFLLKDLKIIKISVLKNKHISVIFKSKIGTSIKSICFNCINTKVGEYLLSYKKNINVIAQIHENVWNNKRSLQLNIKDIIL